MKARQCKHNSRNMKRSGDSEGEKRRKVLIAFFSVRSGIFLSPRGWLNVWCCRCDAAGCFLEATEPPVSAHTSPCLVFLYCVFHFFPTQSATMKNYICIKKISSGKYTCWRGAVACRLHTWIWTTIIVHLWGNREIIYAFYRLYL